MTRNFLTAVILSVLLVATVIPASGAIATEPPKSHGDTDCDFPNTVTDATGTEVTIPDRPERVIVLGPSAAQTTWELGAQDRVVGIDAFSTYLEGTEGVEIVSGGIGQVDYEAALNQSPDLIIVAGNSYSPEVVSEFRRSNVTTFAMPNAGSIEAVYEKTRLFGRLLGTCGNAHEVIAGMQDRVNTVREAVSGEPKPTVFIDFGGVRDESARYSAGPETFVGGIVEAAGTTNIVTEGDFSSPFPQVSNEFILSQDPEWLIVTYTPGSSFGPATPEEAKQAARNSSVLSETIAVQDGNIIAVNANHFSQPAPRLVKSLETITKAIHPEAFEAANQTLTPTVTATETPTETMSDPTATRTATPTTSGESGPGFGLVLTLVTIIVATVLQRRD